MPLLRCVEQGLCDGCAWLETKLQRQRDGEQWAVDMLLMDDVDELLHDSRMLGDNTLVIFTSDNGPHEEGGADPTFFNREGKLRGLKRQCYEGGIRIPFIARWKDHIAARQVSALPFAFYDLMPTFSELAGVKNCAQRYRNRRLKTDYFDGLSIVPTLLGHDAEQQRHPHLYWEFAEINQIAVRRGDWKLVVIKGVLHLYNLKTDLHEDHDLAAEHPAIVQQLVDIIHQEHVDSPLFPITLSLKFRL